MATVRPFRALRPPPQLAARVGCPPYDVVSSDEARAHSAGNRESFFRVSRPEVDLERGIDEHADLVHERGRDNLRELVERGVLVRDDAARLYLYEQVMGAHRQVGVVGCVSVREYVDDVIKKHEKTRADKEDDRARHIERLEAHDEPVFLTYRARPSIDALSRELAGGAPAVSVLAEDGIRHTLWVIDEARGAALAAAFAGVDRLYVADGHHRSAAAARVASRLAGRAGEHDVFPAVLIPHNQVQILAYNRLVRDRRRRGRDALLRDLEAVLELESAPRAEPERPGTFGLYLGGGGWLRGRLRDATREGDVVARLDASRCQERILAPLFDIVDVRRDPDVAFVGGIRGAGELERRVEAGEFAMAICLHPTSIEELLEVSDAGLLMPPKSTWFEPKLRSGLFVHTF